MRYRYNRTGYTGRNGIEGIAKKSTGISLVLHIAGISFLFISPIKKQTDIQQVFTVHVIDMPEVLPSPVISPPQEKKISEIRNIEKKRSVEPKPVVVKEKIPEKREISSFSAEKFKESLLARTDIKSSSEKKNTQRPTETLPLNVEKIESAPAEINISSLMSIPEWYLSTIHSRIKANWKTDNILGQRVAIVSFRIYRDGRIENISLEKSSGNTRFDRSVIEAVIATKNLPQFPVEITHNYLDIIIDFKTEG